MSRRLGALVSFLQAKRYLKWRIFAAVLVALILVSRLVVWFALAQTNDQAAKQNFAMATSQQVSEIRDQFEVYANTLYAARALLLTSPGVSRQNWNAFVEAQKLSERYPAFYALAYIAVIHQAGVEQLTAQLNANRLPSEKTPITVWPQTTGNTLAVVTYIAPSTVPQTNIGYNVLVDPVRAQALAEARDTGLPRASKPLSFTADLPGTPPSVLIVLPSYAASASSLQTVAQRQAAIQGYVVLAVRTKPLLGAMFADPDSSNIAVTIFANGKTVYQHGPKFSGTTIERQQDLTIAGQTWTIDFTAPPTFGLSPIAQITPTILTLSILPFLAVVGLILYFATRVYQPRQRR